MQIQKKRDKNDKKDDDDKNDDDENGTVNGHFPLRFSDDVMIQNVQTQSERFKNSTDAFRGNARETRCIEMN